MFSLAAVQSGGSCVPYKQTDKDIARAAVAVCSFARDLLWTMQIVKKISTRQLEGSL